MAAILPNLSQYQPVNNVAGSNIPLNVSAPKASYANSLASLNLGSVGTPPTTGVTNKAVLPPGFGGLNTSIGATPPTATKITPATQPVQQTTASLAKNNFVSSLNGNAGSAPLTYDYNTGLPLAEGQAQSTVNAQGQPIGSVGSTNTGAGTGITPPATTPNSSTGGVVQSYTQNADGSFTYAPYTPGAPGSPGNNGVQTVNTGNPTYDSAINAYLAALNSSNKLDASAQSQTVSANNQRQADLNATGGTLGGNQQTAALDTRNNDLALANLGVAQTSATNAKSEALQAAQFAQSQLPAPAAPFTLAPGDVRYDAKGNPIAAAPASQSSIKTIGSPTTGVYQQNTDGSWTQTLAPIGGDNVQSLAQQLVTGLLAPQDLSKRSSGVGSISDIITAAHKIDPTFDYAKASTNYTFANNVQTQNTLNYLGSLVGSTDGKQSGNLDQLVTLSKSVAEPKGLFGLGQSNFPALNDATQWARLSSGDPTVAAYYSTLLEVSDQVAKVLQGGGGSGTSDAKLAQAQSLFQKGFTKDQIASVAGTLKELLANRAKSMIGDNPYLSTYAQEFGLTQNNNKNIDSSSNGDTSGSGIYDF